MSLDDFLTQMNRPHRVIHEPIAFEGLGVHSGNPSHVIVEPAPEGSGLVFVRTDLSGHPEVPVVPTSVEPDLCQRCTVLMKSGARISTCEHLLSALVGMGIADARILINQEELPFLDGSSQEYCQRLRSVTSDESGRAGVQRRLRFLRPLLFETGPAQYVIFPSDQLRVSYLYQSQQPLLKFQTACFDGTNYESQIAPARTFGFLNEISPLLAAGLVRGASLANSVVFGNKHLLNNRLRFPNEPARHKILDFLGDMAPLSLPLTGWVLCLRGGHRTNAEFVRFLHEALSRQDGVVAE